MEKYVIMRKRQIIEILISLHTMKISGKYHVKVEHSIDAASATVRVGRGRLGRVRKKQDVETHLCTKDGP